jgi:hypothetical protein
MVHFKKVTLFVIVLLLHVISFAQSASTEVAGDKADVMRSGGKIYVVMAIVITILAGLLIYMARLDRKLSKLEKGGSA